MSSALLTLTDAAANSVTNMMTDAAQGASRLRFINRPSRVTYVINQTGAGAELEIFSGDRTIQQRSELQRGGTFGIPPALDQFGQSFLAAAGEELDFRVRETAGAATNDYTLFVDVSPIA